MLKWSSEEELNEFCVKVGSFFNPKFTGSAAEQDLQQELAAATIYDFAKKCELTEKEFMLALTLATEGKLKSEIDNEGNAETIKLYREIDTIKLGEIKAAYLRYKVADPNYQKGKAEIKAFLDPPPSESTEEEKHKIRLKFLKDEYERLQTKGEVLGSVQYYDLLRKNHDTVKIRFVELFMQTFVPEEYTVEERSTSVHLASSKKIIKKDLFLSFKELFVSSYITKMKLKELTEEQWIEHWERLRQPVKPTKII